MAIRDLVRRKATGNVPVRKADWFEERMASLQREMNRLFDGFFRDWAPAPFDEFERLAVGDFAPRVNVSETDKEVVVSAELPGMDEKDISLQVDEDALTIRGEKRSEHEEKGRHWHRIESSYGTFHRIIPLPRGIDAAKAKAQMKKGVLTVTLPKRPEEAAKRRTIEIKAE